MHILHTRPLLRPNVWGAVHACDVLLRVEAEDLASPCESLAERLRALVPEFDLVPSSGPVAPDAAEGAGHADVLCRLALALQFIGRESSARFHRVVPAGEHRLFRAGLEALDPTLIVTCIHEAVGILHALRSASPPDLEGLRSRLVDHADDVCLGPSTMLIVRAAEERGIPWRRLNDLSLVQFGHGRPQHRIWTAETDRTPAIAEAISRDKQLTKRLLDAAGVPVPRGRLVAEADEAWPAATELGLPVVVKPLDGNHGRGVFVGLSTRDDVERAFAVARAEARPNSPVMIEECIPGVEHRLLVVDGRLVACARGEQVFVTGDGRHTVVELIEIQLNSDPRRGRSETLPNKTIEVDDAVRMELSRAGLGPDSVPPPGGRVLVKRIGTHGCDVTDEVHPEMAAMAVRAARTVGLDVAGIDLVAVDISRSPREQGSRICEVNAGPQLLIHADPGAGARRQVGRDIIATLFAEDETGRIPVVALLGGSADELATDVAAAAVAAGRSPAVTGRRGKWVAGIHCTAADCSAPAAAAAVLVSTEIDAAIFSLDWRSVASHGSPVDRIDALIITNLPDLDPAGGSAALLDSPRAAVQTLAAALPADATILLVDAPSWVHEAIAPRKFLATDMAGAVRIVASRLA